jgi:hypothetical protein
MPEGGDQHGVRQRPRIGEAVAVPPVGAPVLKAGRRRCVQQRQQRGDGPSGGHRVGRLTSVQVDGAEHGPRHDRALCHPCAFQRTVLGQCAVAAHHRVQFRLDIEAMWMRATSSEIPRMRAFMETDETGVSDDSGDQASTTRPKRSPSVTSPESRRRTAVSMVSVTSSRAARSAHLPEAATAAIASGWTKASEPSRVSNAAIRCPSRRVIPKTSTVPWDPSSATVCSSAWSRLFRYDATSSRRNNESGSVRRPSKISSGSLRRSIR